MMESQPPLMVCMENVAGEEVSLSVEPHDDFQAFLVKANALLGYEVDLNSVTRNQPVALTDNVYQFLMNAENNMLEYPQLGTQSFDQMLEPTDVTDDLVYVLDDGTQIKASQIHFDNEDPPVDFIAERIPFVKYVDDGNDDTEEPTDFNMRMINIVESPVARWSSNSSPKKGFVNSLPFKLVSNNTSVFEAQFSKYLEANNDKTFTALNPVTARNKSPRSLIRDNYKKYDDVYNRSDNYTLTRDEVLNLFKDPPVALPYESSQGFSEKRRHVRKTDPSRPGHKGWNCKSMPYVDVDGTLIGQNESQNCFICEKFVENNIEKLYLFDNEDQRLHRSSPPKKLSTQLKIICEQCLNVNFKPSRMKSPNKNLNSDEYLVIRNNQQYIFQKTNQIDFKNTRGFVNAEASAIIDKIESEMLKGDQVKQSDFVKVEIGSDGEIKEKNVIKDEKDGSSSDVEIIEGPEIDDVIDNLDEADEEVKEFLGMYQRDNVVGEFKCRFCEIVFADIPELMDHGDVHKHVLEDGEVFPCPLCNYGYANFKWLRGHIKAAHDQSTKLKVDGSNNDENKDKEGGSPNASPVATRTRSNKKSDKDPNDPNDSTTDERPEKETEATNGESTMVIKTEVKQEALDTSDEEAIWIVHTADADAASQLHTLLQLNLSNSERQSDMTTYDDDVFLASEKTEEPLFKKPQKCVNCSQIMVDVSTHKCRKRGRKRKSVTKDTVICVPTREDFIKRAQGRPRQVTDDSGDNDLLVVRSRRKKTTELTSDPQIVTCHNCNESFTSKVRLKFHMQFHDATSMLTPGGQYACRQCAGAVFATETQLFDHVHFQHHKQRRWQCPVQDCGKTFFLRATLTKHSRTHTDTRRYVCGTCGKRFLDKQTLDEHGVTHLQIKPFQCHICLKQLTRRSRLRMHLRAHEEALCPALVLVCAACRRAFCDVAAAQEHAIKSTECIEAFAKEMKEDAEEPAAVLSPTSGLVRPTQRKPESSRLTAPIPREAACAGAGALLAPLPGSLRAAIRAVRIEKAFRCEYCEDVFYLEEALNNHRIIHKGIKNPFTCHICKVSFATYSRCTTHKTTHGFYKRSLADAKKLDKPSQEEAGPSANGILGYGGFPVVKHFLCEDCGRSYLHWTYLQVHRRMKHANENFLYKCNYCDLTFPNSWCVAYHRKKIHGKTGLDEGNGTTKIVKDDYKIPCRDCEEVLPNKTALYKHRKKEHSDLSLQINSTQVVHTCHVCNKQYASRAGLDAHTRTHTSRAACAQCGESFTHTRALHQHLQDIHGHELDFHCNVCEKRFNSRTELSAHIRTHSAQRPHACAVCGHAFRTLSMLNEHTRIHTGERPFPCDVCGVAFRRSTAMRNHRLIHTGVRAWPCTRCPKRFRIRSDLNTHRRLKHPAHLAVIEVEGLSPGPEAVLAALAAGSIPHEHVLEITKMSFAKGTSSIVPDCSRALTMLSGVQRTQVSWGPTLPIHTDYLQEGSMVAEHLKSVIVNLTPWHVGAEGLQQAARRGRGIAKQPRRPAILQRAGAGHAGGAAEPPELNVQMLLRDNSLDARQGALPLDASLLIE